MSKTMADEPYDTSAERDALLRKWNPPPEDHAMGHVLGIPVPEGDARATNHEPMDVMNQHILTGSGAPEDSDDEDLPEDYDEWTNAQLRKEIERRNEDRAPEDRLNVSGRHAELVERLEEDDEDDEEDEDE